MSDPNETLGRQPIELVEFVLPKCANDFASLPCHAGLGTVYDGNEAHDYLRQGVSATWLPVNGTQSAIDGGVRFTATASNLYIITGARGDTFSGDEYRYIVIKGKWVSGGSNDMTLGFASGGGSPFGAGVNITPTNTSISYRGALPTDELTEGDEFTLIYDAATAADYATDWQGQDIDQLFFRFAFSASADVVFDLYSIQIISDDPFASVGSECFNCRATCQDPDNYQARPLAHLTPDRTLAQGETGTTDFNGETEYFVEVDMRIPLDPDGIVFKVGGASAGAAIYFLSGNLVIRAGDGSAPDSSTTSKFVFDPSDWLGKSVRLITQWVVADAGGFDKIDVLAWIFDPVELEFTYLGKDRSASVATNIFETGDWSVGENTGDFPGGETTTDYNGTINALYMYDAQSATLYADQDAYRNNLFIGRGQKGEPDVGKPILSCLGSLGTIGTKINLSGADDNYQPLGRRATLDFTVNDFAHSDIGQDPYYATRPYDPFERSTFWRKWLSRQKFGKVGARVRVYDGYAGQAISAYKRRGYVLEETKINEEGLSFYARDELARTELLKAQVPAASPGSLDVDITDTATSMTMNGDFTPDYPAAGTLRINDEIITYTGVSYSDPTTTFTGLTRGTDGSTAAAHDADDQVQLCRRLSGTVEQVITELLAIDAKIESQLVDFAGLASEQILYLGAYSLETLVSEVTGVDTVLGWICQESGVYVWWDERQQQIRIKAIRAISADDIVKELTHESNIVAGTFRIAEKPRQRLNSITIYYNPIDFAGELDDTANFANSVKIVNGTNSSIDQYGNVLQAKALFSRFLDANAEVAQTGARLANRYQDVPIEAKLAVDAKDRDTWTGDIVSISSPVLVDDFGERDVRRWLIVEAEEVAPGHMVQYTVSDVTLDGKIFTITADGIGTYTAALLADGNAFITDNDGLNSDGTPGARII